MRNTIVFQIPYLQALSNFQKSRVRCDTAEMNIFLAQANVIYTDWNITGRKDDFEKAAAYISFIKRNNEIIFYAEALKQINPISSEYFINDANMEDYYYTSFYPDINESNWQREEVEYKSFSPFTDKSESNYIQILNPKITFQYAIIHILRPWFIPN